MRSSRLSSLVAAAAIGALAAMPSVHPTAGFSRASHTTRRRTNPVDRYRPKDPDIARWNAEVDRRKAERKGARS